MIIGLAGRLGSGKTELAKVCEEHGYEKLYFALPLKNLCAKLLGVTVDELNRMKTDDTRIDFTLTHQARKDISEHTGIGYETITDDFRGRKIGTVREMLQVIGTDLIRRYSPNWHVGEIRKMIEDGKDYVLDDIRFPNEKEMVEELGGDVWFVVRPDISNVSNHESENSLTWRDCWNKIIINDKTLEELRFRWSTFVEDYSQSVRVRDKEYMRILGNGIPPTVEDVSPQTSLMLPYEMFVTREDHDYDEGNIAKIEQNDYGTVTIHYDGGVREKIKSPLIIEDVKLLKYFK